MMSWTWPLVDLGVNREATPAGRAAILDLHPGEGRRAVHGGGRGAIPITTRVLTPTRVLTRIGSGCS